jgi:hypothetical protein
MHQSTPPALAITGSDLIGALAKATEPVRRPGAIRTDDVERAAGRAWNAQVASNARLMRAEPWRIARLLGHDAIWPVEDTDLTELLADAAKLLRASINQGRSGWWVYSVSLHLTREAAVDALLAMIMEDA